MTRSDKIVAAVLLLLLAAGAAWFWSRLERVHERLYVGPRGAASSNPWLGCERMYGELGLPVQHATDLAVLPPTDHVLFLGASSVYENEKSASELLDWVTRGGVLVLLLPSREEQRLLVAGAIANGRHEFRIADALEVALHTNYDDDPDDKRDDKRDDRREKLDADEERETEGPEELPVTELDLGFGPRRIANPSDIWFESPAGEGLRNLMLQRERGAGQVVFLASDAWLSNERFGDHDHARFAWEMSQLGGLKSGATFVPTLHGAGLLAWLGSHAWMVLASAAVFIALWLWRRGARFGPLLADLPRDRRDFSEHVEATADFLWREGQGTRLLAAPRAELERRIGTLRPDLAGAPASALHEELARISGLKIPAVHDALLAEPVTEAERFQRIVRDLAQLRHSL